MFDTIGITRGNMKLSNVKKKNLKDMHLLNGKKEP